MIIEWNELIVPYLYRLATPALLAAIVAACAAPKSDRAGPSSPTSNATVHGDPFDALPKPKTPSEAITFHFGGTVSPEMQNEIKRGVNLCVDWLKAKTEDGFEGLSVFAYDDSVQAVDEYAKRAHLLANTSLRESLRNVTAFAGQSNDFYIITTSAGWTKASPIIGGPIVEGRFHTICHELFHVYQRDVGGFARAPLGWLSEGGAHYIAARILDDAGLYSYEEIKRRHLSRSDFFTDDLVRLENQAEFARGDNYSLSFLAMDLLTRDLPDRGIDAITAFWKEIGHGSDSDAAFLQAFGKSKQEFYRQFSAWQADGYK